MAKVIDQVVTDDYGIYNADCVEGLSGVPDNSIGFSVYSPPFASLYTYSNSDRDMGNSASDQEFADHYKFLIKEHMRTMIPGRIVAVHCMNLPTSKQREGAIGIRDFRGEIIRAFTDAGFIYHSEVCIWKNPVTAMQRTKAVGLLHKTIEKDSSMSRMGIPDHLVMFQKPDVADVVAPDTLVMFRKPGDNPENIAGYFELDHYAGLAKPDVAEDAHNGEIERWNSINIWQRYASPVWFDINQSNTLQFRQARDSDDERHICPLQLDVIARCIQLWSNPGDTVLTPFMGIGSEVYTAVKMGRQALGFELKDSYFNIAKKNAELAVQERDAGKLF
jgi:DNA modification methylase